MNPPLRLQFSSRRRISRSSDFARLKEEGRREICGTLILNWLPSKELRLGVVTSRKVGSAVIRSRARRLLREVFRQHQYEVTEPVSIYSYQVLRDFNLPLGPNKSLHVL